MSGSYRAWLVDLDGTLYRASPLRLAMMGELLAFGTRSIPALRVFRKEQELMRTDPTARESPYEYQLHQTARKLGTTVNVIRPTVEEWMFRRPEKWIRVFRRRALLKKIEQFRRHGGRVAIVSDYPATQKLRALQAGNLFDVVIANGEPNGPSRVKPWPDGYLAAANTLQVEVSECLVIGDRVDTDGVAAKQALMDFCLVQGLRSGPSASSSIGYQEGKAAVRSPRA